MSSSPVIRITDLWKEYRLGTISHRTLAKDLQTWWAGIRGQQDPNAKLAAEYQDDASSTGPADRFWALKNVSLEVCQGEVLGIIGANGAGKSTLLKILSRVTKPTRGEIKVRGRIASLLEVGTGFHPELTGRENVFLNGAILGMTKNEIKSKFDEIVDFADIEKFVDTPVKRYSSGMYVRLAFAVAAHLEPEILIVDEVLAVGDEAFRRKCIGKMRDVAAGGRTVFFVSHNMTAVRRLCSRGVLMERGSVALVGSANEVAQSYLQAQSASEALSVGLSPGTLFRDPSPRFVEGCAVTGIEMLDSSMVPKPTLSTWDYVRFRIHFESKRKIEKGSVVMQVSTKEGVPLHLTSTRPDSNVDCRILVGTQYVDCIYSRWPFSAGDYQIGAGLAVPGVHMINWDESLCTLPVTEEDVYESGLAPNSKRYWVAADHKWELPNDV